MLAKAFSAFTPSADVVIFASGVSDSMETRASIFARERELLECTRAAHADRLLVYFGTCSAEDPDRRETPYVQHKLQMESLLTEQSAPWMVIRLPLAIGREHRSPTLANFLHERISRGESFEVWARSTRYPIDVEDAFRITARFIAARPMWQRTINVALRAFPVLDFVHILEAITGKKARYTVVDKGAHYVLQCPEVAAVAAELELDFGPGYLERVLRKYFAR